MQQQQEDLVNRAKHNPIAASFGAGINQPQVIPDKRRQRRVKFRMRDFESYDDG